MNKLNYFLSFLVLSLNLFSDPLTKPTRFSKDQAIAAIPDYDELNDEEVNTDDE